MHDPMVVAFDVPSLVPHRERFHDAKPGGQRWGFRVFRRTNDENLGERAYPWWRPRGYTLLLAGRAYKLGTLATVWHVEPRGRDAFEVCKRKVKANGRYDRAWVWHVHHWKVQVQPWPRFIRRFARCAECHRRMNKASRHGYMNGDAVYHGECMSLRHFRSAAEDDAVLIRNLFAAYRTAADLDALAAIKSLAHMRDGEGRPHSGFRAGMRLKRLVLSEAERAVLVR